MAKQILRSVISPVQPSILSPMLTFASQSSTSILSKLPRTLLTGILSLGAATALYSQEPFAQDIVPTVTFSESYVDVLKSTEEYGYFVEPSADLSKLSVTAQLSTAGIDLSTLNAETPFDIAVGDFEVSGVLGDDPAYKAGATSIRVPVIDPDWETGEDIEVGQAVISWNAKAINVSVVVQRPETYSAAASYYVGGEDKIEDTTSCYIAFADRELSDRTVYLEGNAELRTKTVGSGANAEDFELSKVQITGAIDTIRPKVKISGIKNNAVVDSADFTLNATASDNRSVVEVLALVNDDEEFVGLYEGEDGKWSLEGITLNYGNNVIRLKAIDEDGVESLIEETVVRYWTPLVINVSGKGTVTKGFVGSTLREPGAPLSIKATPADGYIFAGWTGSISSSSDALSFQMQSGLTLTANFIPNPFVAVKGSYTGLLTPDQDSAGAGSVNVQLTGAGTFTAKVTLNDRTETLNGSFDHTGHFTGTLASGSTPLSVDLQLDQGNGANAISGVITDGTNSFSLNSERNTYSAKNPAPQAGYYTVVLPAGDPGTPQGNGYATLNVAASGAATLTGALADGTSFSYAASVSKNGTLGVYFTPYSGKGSVYGTLTFRNVPNQSDVDGTLSWIKAPAATQDGFYTAGFSTTATLVGSLYEQPRGKQRIISLANTTANAKVIVGEGGIANPIQKTVTIANNNRFTVTAPGADKLSVSIAAPNGLFSGTVVEPSTGAKRKFNGVFLQKANLGAGVFRGANSAGYISITAP